MAAFWAVFTFGGSSPALTAHSSLDLKQEIQIQIAISNGHECDWTCHCTTARTLGLLVTK
jgi:hypothetical protein